MEDEIRRDLQDGTRGPWFRRPRDPRRINGPDGRSVAAAHLDGSNNGETLALANARRIARTPELEAAYLAALDRIEELEAALLEIKSLVRR